MDKKIVFIADYAFLASGRDRFVPIHRDNIYQMCDNTIGALRDVASKERISIDPKWNTRHTGAKIIKALGGNDQASTHDYVIVKKPDNSIKVYKKCDDINDEALADLTLIGMLEFISEFERTHADGLVQRSSSTITSLSSSTIPGKKLIIVSPITLNISYDGSDDEIEELYKNKDIDGIIDYIKHQCALYFINDTYWSIPEDREPVIFDADELDLNALDYAQFSSASLMVDWSEIGEPIKGVGIWKTNGRSNVPSGLPSDCIKNLRDWSKKAHYNDNNIALVQHYPYKIWGSNELFIYRRVIDNEEHPHVFECEIDLNGRPFATTKLYFFQESKTPTWCAFRAISLIQLSGIVYDGRYYPLKWSKFEDGQGFKEDEVVLGIRDGDLNYGKGYDNEDVN